MALSNSMSAQPVTFLDPFCVFGSDSVMFFYCKTEQQKNQNITDVPDISLD